MLPLYEMLLNADNGRAMDLLARQFDISRKQAELAVEALTPAFSHGLKQNASDPYGVGAFLQALASGNHAKYFEDATKAFQPAGVDEGNGILGHLFGSKEVSRAVAAQAATATGLGQDLLKQMLPVLASMIMGGLFKQSTGQMQGGQMQGSAGDNPLTQVLEQMMGQAAGSRPRAPHPEAPQPGMNKFDIPLGDSPFGKALEGMFGGAGASSGNPFGKMFEDMMGGGRDEPKAKANPSGRARSPYDDIFGNMFEAGAKTRDDYQKNIESIFDQFKKGMDRPR